MAEIVKIGDATLYHGDCLEILPTLDKVDAVVTDPLWPTCPVEHLSGQDAEQLLQQALSKCTARTVIIHLGFDCDPRFLRAVPDRWPFIRYQTAGYAMPGYRGRLLGGDEVIYVFGELPEKHTGLIPGRCHTEASTKASRANGHPFPRAEKHVTQLVGWWSPERGSVLDPFMGSGTTGVACANLGRKFIGIEIERKYFDIACERIKATYAQGQLFT